MGQSSSSSEGDVISIVHGKLASHLGVIKKLAVLSYQDFLSSLEEINRITSGFTDPRAKQLLFIVKAGSDDTFLWKGTVRIRCNKVNTRTGTIESHRTLNLKQYIEVYQEITDQVANLKPLDGSDANGHGITASCIFDQVDNVSCSADDECCICMENKSDLILSCSHKFCEGCIDSWNVTQLTCPLCRQEISGTDDTWVLTEKPDSTEYESEIKGYLVGLADRNHQQPH